MAINSHIEWTGATWNPITGCTKVSPGCANCYAARMARRLKEAGMRKYRNGFELTLHREQVREPLTWRKPQRIFVCSMSDLFHREVPTEFIRELFDVMREADWHQFQVLTKRAERIAELNGALEWPENIWLGVTVEEESFLHRLEHLRASKARIRFVSFEPLLGPLPRLDLRGIDWVIVGGESGPGARPIKQEWVIEIRDQCLAAGVPFFFKQWGGVFRSRSGRLLEGRTWDEMPRIGERTQAVAR